MAPLATRKILIFWLVSVAEQASLILTRSDKLKTGYLTMRSSNFREDVDKIPISALFDERLKVNL